MIWSRFGRFGRDGITRDFVLAPFAHADPSRLKRLHRPAFATGNSCANLGPEAASCGDYESYVADQGATVPTECNFCPPRAVVDAGAE